MTKILMVCLGNICRSPLAEGILRSKLPYEDFVVDSAGTSSYHIRSNPDNRSITVGNKYGINISKLMGRQFSVSDFNDFDIIYAMDASNYRDILHLARNEKDKDKVKMILNEVYPNQNYDVPDPYHGGTHGFENVYKMLDEACDVIVEKLK
ncbi:low molecular weight protein-tyrosine-phosphatase [Formosa sp. PL04]|uniref:low molecular weight protein-tyrosine-phosphatase n=1 Tax=Formosa sp. PL04 TaxID=3081755 RepID=UPI002982A3E8|nr:low molecular weight protein-tyrosine-phosphatase [Formosa sp. PL04]MDW5289432.1 low molecular weight protein-tyrosine-phosphatase [Formosa sp. PL04]